MNVIILTGRLTRDPELKFGQSGKAYSRFTLAVDRPMQKGEADFINCVAFGKTAELIGEYLRKGRKEGVTGRLQMGKYEVNGEKRTSYDVVVDTIEFLESKNAVDSMGGYEPQDYTPSYSAPSSNSNTSSKPVAKPQEEVPYEDDDEFPF
ncbi:MAG: single-stranded DNA-binding protein [Fusobacterium sp.]